MGRIQSSVGLITGVPIQDTVNQLMQISARPRDLLASRSEGYQAQQIAIAELIAVVISVQSAAAALGKESTYTERTAVSSKDALLTATASSDTPFGNYSFTPVRQAQTQQLLSSGFASRDEPIGEGSFSLRFGGFVDEAVELDRLRGGDGVQRGKIRITDRSGASAVVDLRFAATVGDVIAAINSNETINVTASTRGDSFHLVDYSGGSGQLRVQEVEGGSTAADLGLLLSVAADEAAGQDVFQLYDGLELATLNDGNGVSLRAELADLTVTFRNGSSPLSIDLGEISTVGELLDALGAADPARLSASISADGDRIELTDLTADTGGTFSVASAHGGSVAEELGLTATAPSGVITGRRLQGGLATTLLSSFNGGAGLGTLGEITITDRSGALDTIDLAGAETLDDVVTAINDAAVGVTARINKARTGIELVDTTGASASNLIVASADVTDSAEALGIAVDDAVTSVGSGSLNLQVVSRSTLLSSLNRGEGIGGGSFLIKDSAGASGAVNLTVSGAKTIGDVIDEINALPIGVTARINDAGDGILLQDDAGGAQTLQVTDVGNGKVAARLSLAGVAETVDVEGTPTQVINGSTSLVVEIGADDTLDDLVTKINGLGAGVQASVFNLGGGTQPFRLSLISEISGSAGAFTIDAAGAPLSFQEIQAAQDALLLYGSPTSAGAGFLIASSSNTFEDLVGGLDVTIHQASQEAVNVSVGGSDKTLVTAVTLMVDSYNKIRDKLAEKTFFNEESNETGVLFGSNEALRVDSDLARLFSSRITGVGDIQSLSALGISLRDDGKLELDKAALQAAYAADPDAVRELFASENVGFVARLNTVADSLAGVGNSLLVNRSNTLKGKVDDAAERIAFFNERLAHQRERLLLEFYRLEQTIGKMKNTLDSVVQIQAIPPLYLQS
jgi:flagellar hook-associated protein 2